MTVTEAVVELQETCVTDNDGTCLVCAEPGGHVQCCPVGALVESSDLKRSEAYRAEIRRLRFILLAHGIDAEAE